MFFDLPSDKTCIHPEHDPPTGLYIPPGKGYRHVCPACKTVKDVIPLQYSLTQQSQMPQAWKVTEDMHRAAVKVLHRANGLDGLPQRMLDAMLAAAPRGDLTPSTGGEIIASQEALIATKDALYRSRIGLQCSCCRKGTYRADGNGYYDFHRCDQCRYVPMWNQDGTEFGIQEKRNGPSI